MCRNNEMCRGIAVHNLLKLHFYGVQERNLSKNIVFLIVEHSNKIYNWNVKFPRSARNSEIEKFLLFQFVTKTNIWMLWRGRKETYLSMHPT